MAGSGSGAVFFLGSRAHYQVLQQPESRSYDVENGNASTESIYQNPSTVQELWNDNSNTEASGNYNSERNWNNYDKSDFSEDRDRMELCTGVKRRVKRHSSEMALCERDNDNMRPALLNMTDNDTSKTKPPRRISIKSFLTSLARRRRRLGTEQMQYLQHIESVLTTCTYRESCRCLECQSRYFECDESEDYSSDESDYSSRYTNQPAYEAPVEYDEDDEVFVDTVPEDNTSTDLLIEGKEKMSVSSDEAAVDDEEDQLQLEVAAGTPVLLNYLLTHPITCNIQ